MVRCFLTVCPLLVIIAAVITHSLIGQVSATTSQSTAPDKNTKCSKQEITSCIFPVWRMLKTKYDLLRSTSRLEFTESDFGNVCATLLARVSPCMQRLDATCDGYTLHALRTLNNTFKYMCNFGWDDFQHFRGCYSNASEPLVRNKVRQCYQKSGLAHREFFDAEKDTYEAYQTDWWYRNRRDEFYQEHVSQDHQRSQKNPKPTPDNHDYMDYEQIHKNPFTIPNYFYLQHPILRVPPFGYHRYFENPYLYGLHPEEIYNHWDFYHRNIYNFGRIHHLPYGYQYGTYFPTYGLLPHFLHPYLNPSPYAWNHPAFVTMFQQPHYGFGATHYDRDFDGNAFTDAKSPVAGDSEGPEDGDRDNGVNDGYVRLRNYNYDTCKGFEMMLHCVNEFKNRCSKEGERWFIKLNDMVYQIGCLILFCRY